MTALTPPPPHGQDLAAAVALFTRIRREGQWESAQTHASLLPYLVEETWELIDAVTEEDRAELRGELGDLLLQVLFHAAIAAEDPQDPFDIDAVARTMLDKLRRRAPYWFTEGPQDLDPAEQDRLWRSGKKRETGQRPIFAGVSWSQPALALADKVLARCAEAGVPADVVPHNVRCIELDPAGSSLARGSTEVRYREVVRRFARQVESAEAVLRAAGQKTPYPAAAWRAALDSLSEGKNIAG